MVKTVTLAQPGGTSTGTLTNGTNYTVVIPAQAGQTLLNELTANKVVDHRNHDIAWLRLRAA